MNAEQRSEMFDRALKLNAVDRAELRARKDVKSFLKTPYAPPVIVIGFFGTLEVASRLIEEIR